MAQIAVAAPLNTLLSYEIPAELQDRVRPGLCLQVPLGRRQVQGLVFSVGPGDTTELKPVTSVPENPLPLPGTLLELLRRAGDYYCHPPGEVVRQALPAGLMSVAPRVSTLNEEHYALSEETGTPSGERQREVLNLIRQEPGISRSRLRDLCPQMAAPVKRLQELGWVQTETRERYRDPLAGAPALPDPKPSLTEEQQACLLPLKAIVDAPSFQPFLLQGVTGSGKTEIYLQWIESVLTEGGQALVLVPEIALTPQLVGRFRGRFEGRARLAVWHSALSDGERYDSWRRMARGEVDIVIGARSAIFAPLDRLRAIVVDEEHDSSYKQSEGFRYNGRDLALLRAQIEDCPVLLGSATPSLVSWYHARQGRYQLLQLMQRPVQQPLPEVAVVDMTDCEHEQWLSPDLASAIQGALDRQEQALLLLNRRGYSPFLLCEDCGTGFHCPNCDITLTYHQRSRELICHYCDYRQPPPEACPQCEGHQLTPKGIGTERLEETLEQTFPGARIARLDRDSTSGKRGHQKLVDRMRAGDIDILVGTQMVAKGHDFPKVTVVGVVSADSSLNLPDFRAAERTFSLLTQVAGRAGRADRPGQVLIQTYSPDHYAVLKAASHDVNGFLEEEQRFRQALAYPPYGHLVNFVLAGNRPEQVEGAAEDLSRHLNRFPDVEVLGPSPCVMARLRGKTRWQVLVKADQRGPLRNLLSRMNRGGAPAGVQLSIDVDPVDMF